MNIVVVNVSKGYYNVGARKLADWMATQGHEVQVFDGDPGLFMPRADAVYTSAIFSWHAPVAAEITNRMKDRCEVSAGGPGLFAMGKWWREQTGLYCHHGLDPRFDRQRGNYRMTFASRGCSVGCYFCIVPQLEGTTYSLDWDFQPAPILCDNNLSDLPDEFQDHIVQRYRDTGTRLVDANSGFEPRSFGEDTFHRWSPLLQGPWRFAFDAMNEEVEVKRMMMILRDVPARRKRVYCLIGNEPFKTCMYRARRIIEWGGEPYCQPYTPLNAIRRSDYKVAYDWTKQRLTDMTRYFNRWIFRNVAWEDYGKRPVVTRESQPVLL